MAGTQMKLHFGGVKFNSQVYLNGTLIGTYLNGYEPFEFDVNTNIVVGSLNELNFKPLVSWSLLTNQPFRTNNQWWVLLFRPTNYQRYFRLRTR